MPPRMRQLGANALASSVEGDLRNMQYGRPVSLRMPRLLKPGYKQRDPPAPLAIPRPNVTNGDSRLSPARPTSPPAPRPSTGISPGDTITVRGRSPAPATGANSSFTSSRSRVSGEQGGADAQAGDGGAGRGQGRWQVRRMGDRYSSPSSPPAASASPSGTVYVTAGQADGKGPGTGATRTGDPSRQGPLRHLSGPLHSLDSSDLLSGGDGGGGAGGGEDAGEGGAGEGGGRGVGEGQGALGGGVGGGGGLGGGGCRGCGRPGRAANVVGGRAGVLYL